MEQLILIRVRADEVISLLFAVANWKWPEYQKCNCNQTGKSLE